MTTQATTMVESLPAGEYWVGDLCYVLSDECWKEVCERPTAEDDEDETGDGVYQLKDGRLIGIVSVSADGRYRALNPRGKTVAVDSGSIGCILLSSITPPERDDLGFVQVFGNNSRCYFDDEKAVLGPVRISVPEDDYE